MINDIIGNVYVKDFLLALLPMFEMGVWFMILNAFGLFATGYAPLAALVVLGSVTIDRILVAIVKRSKCCKCV